MARGMAALALPLMLATASRGADAAESVCPTTPSGFASFTSALNSLIDRFSGWSQAGTVSPLSELDTEQEKDVLDQLAAELVGKRAELADEREADEAAERLENLRRRILSRDRLEQGARLARRRGQDAMGQVASPRLAYVIPSR